MKNAFFGRYWNKNDASKEKLKIVKVDLQFGRCCCFFWFFSNRVVAHKNGEKYKRRQESEELEEELEALGEAGRVWGHSEASVAERKDWKE